MKLQTILNEIKKIPDKYIKDVAVEVLNSYRVQSKSKVNYDLEDSIARFGVREPLMMIYFVHDDKAGLYDGHHRLDTAVELGLKTVPVYVLVSGNDAPPSAKPVTKTPNWKGKDYLNPEEIGL